MAITTELFHYYSVSLLSALLSPPHWSGSVMAALFFGSLHLEQAHTTGSLSSLPTPVVLLGIVSQDFVDERSRLNDSCVAFGSST